MLKKYFLLPLFIFPFALIAQEGVAPNINNLSPKWYHILQDTNFVQDTFGTNFRSSYDICVPYTKELFEDHLIINNYCINGFGDFHGNIIQNIDPKTGNMRWAKALNNDNYLKDQEFFPSVYTDIKNRKVELRGFKKIGKLTDHWISRSSLFSSIDLDLDNGKITNHVTNNNLADTIKWGRTYNSPFRTSTGSYYYMDGNDLGSEFEYTLYKVSDDYRLVTKPGFKVSEKNIGTPFYSLGKRNFIGADEHDNCYGLIVQKQQFALKPFSINLYKFNIEDNPDIEDAKLDIEYTKDLSPYLRLPESVYGLFPYHEIYNDAIYLNMLYIDSIDFMTKKWILALDSTGKVMYYIDALTTDGKHFPVGSFFMGRKNQKVYLMINAIETGSRTIISIDDKGNIQEYATLRSGNPASKVDGISGLMVNDQIVISARVDEKYWYTAAYEAKDYGIDFSSSTEAIANHQDPFKIYPNPTHQMVTIQSEHGSFGTFYLYDAMGRVVRNMTLQGTYTTLDLSDLPTGVYNLKLPTDDHAKLLFHKVVKW